MHAGIKEEKKPQTQSRSMSLICFNARVNTGHCHHRDYALSTQVCFFSSEPFISFGFVCSLHCQLALSTLDYSWTRPNVQFGGRHGVLAGFSNRRPEAADCGDKDLEPITSDKHGWRE